MSDAKPASHAAASLIEEGQRASQHLSRCTMVLASQADGIDLALYTYDLVRACWIPKPELPTVEP